MQKLTRLIILLTSTSTHRHPGAGRDLGKIGKALRRDSLNITETLGGPGLRQDDGATFLLSEQNLPVVQFQSSNAISLAASKNAPMPCASSLTRSVVT